MFTLGAILQSVGSIYTGVTTFRAASAQAEEMESEGFLALDEAFREASIVREEGRSFAATQSLQYIGAGVELVGSALITTAQTLKFAETEAGAIETRGKARARKARREAEKARSQGRAALVGGVIKSIVPFI